MPRIYLCFSGQAFAVTLYTYCVFGTAQRTVFDSAAMSTSLEPPDSSAASVVNDSETRSSTHTSAASPESRLEGGTSEDSGAPACTCPAPQIPEGSRRCIDWDSYWRKRRWLIIYPAKQSAIYPILTYICRYGIAVFCIIVKS